MLGTRDVWQLDFWLSPPEDCGAYAESPIKVRYARGPNVAAAVWFLSPVYHFQASDAPNDLFFDELGEVRDVGGVVRHLVQFLRGPLHPCTQCKLGYLHSAGNHRQRRETIATYATQRRFPELFGEVQDSWLAPELREFLGGKMSEEAFFTQHAEDVFSFPMFTPEFCSNMLVELDNFYATGLPAHRPNSMNNYGVILNDVGFYEMFSCLMQRVLHPLGRGKFPREAISFDHHHSFIVRYRADEDLGLDMHTDDSDVTFNVCIGREFTGSGLTFCGGMGKPDHRKFSHRYEHVIGRCVMHPGARRHGADDIVSGERNNIIIWCRSTAFRASPHYTERVYMKESRPPDPVCLSFTHDRDFTRFKQVPPGRQLGTHPWCPPEHAAYESPDTISQTP